MDSSSDQNSESSGALRQPFQLFLLLVLAGVLFFLGLGATGLTDRDEGRNAEASREMYERGEWVSPTFNYEPRFAKPALVYWLMSLSYHTFGVNEFSARFPSAVFGMGLIVLQYLFLVRSRGPVVALFGAAMLLLNVQILGLGRMALTDSALIFFIALSLYGFWLGFYGEGRTRHWMWIFYVGMALATLTKGPVGFLVPLITVGLYLFVVREWAGFWQRGLPITGLLIFLLLALPWYVAMLMIHGKQYVSSARADTVGRFSGAMEGHGGTPLFYIPIFLVGFFPWSGWLPFAWYQAFRSWRLAWKQGRNKRSVPLELRLDWFAAIWVIAGLVFFSLSSTRLPHYIAPLFPAAATLTASFWYRCVSEVTVPGMRAAIHTMTAFGYVLALAFACLPSLYAQFVGKLVKEFPAAAQMDVGNGPYIIAFILLIGTALVSYFGLSESRRPAAFWAAGATLAMVVLVITQFILPLLNHYYVEPPQQLAEVAGLNLGREDRLIVYGQPRPSLVFYARRKAIMIPVNEEGNIKQYLNHPGRTMLLLPQAMRGRLPLETMDYPVVLQRYGYILLSSQSMVRTPPSTEAPDSPPMPIPGH